MIAATIVFKIIIQITIQIIIAIVCLKLTPIAVRFIAKIFYNISSLFFKNFAILEYIASCVRSIIECIPIVFVTKMFFNWIGLKLPIYIVLFMFVLLLQNYVYKVVVIKKYRTIQIFEMIGGTAGFIYGYLLVYYRLYPSFYWFFIGCIIIGFFVFNYFFHITNRMFWFLVEEKPNIAFEYFSRLKFWKQFSDKIGFFDIDRKIYAGPFKVEYPILGKTMYVICERDHYRIFQDWFVKKYWLNRNDDLYDYGEYKISECEPSLTKIQNIINDYKINSDAINGLTNYLLNFFNQKNKV